MNEISIRHLVGATPLSSTRSAPPDPSTVQQAVGQPLNNPQAAVTPLPITGNAEWRQNTEPDGQRQDSQTKTSSSSEQLAETLDHLNQRLRYYNTTLQFDIDSKHGNKIVVRIIDQETKEVVKQIPPEKALEFAAFFDELEAQNNQISSESPQKKSASDSSGLKLEGLLFSDKA